MIVLTEQVLSSITDHAERDYPHECGGMLIGHFADDGRKAVTEVFPLENAREEESRHDRILLLPADLLKVERYAREKRLDVVGYYHSHPDDTAIPSQYDLDHALPVWSYVIASAIKGKVEDVRSWEMEDNRSKFYEETIQSGELATETHG